MPCTGQLLPSGDPQPTPSLPASEESGFFSAASNTAASLCRGPGLLESLGWFAGAWGLHLLGVAGTAGLLLFILVSGGMDWLGLEVAEFLESQKLSLLAGEQFVFVTVVFLAAWWRLGGRLGQRLGSRPLPLEHVLLLTCLILPLSTICSLLHAWGMSGWQVLLENYPQWRLLDAPQAMDVLRDLQSSTPLWAMLLVFAVAPAFGEELVFRGVIGRGLVARWGMLPGILITSLLFAAAHVHPVHILAVLPMGLVLHYVYFTTRSFWAPLYVHFGNNALAVMIGRSTEPAMIPEQLSISALLTVSLSLLIFLALLWHTRIHFVREDGSSWTGPRFQLELPMEIPLRRTYDCLSWHVSLGGLVPLLGFLAVCRNGL